MSNGLPLKFQIQSYDLKTLIDEIRIKEVSALNRDKNGCKIFTLKIRTASDKVEPKHQLSKIPLGNYYLEFLNSRSYGRQVFVTGYVDLKLNQNFEITKKAYHPLYWFEKTLELPNADKSTVLLHDYKFMYACSLSNRLTQIISNKGAAHDPTLVSESIRYALTKHSEDTLGNKANYRIKVMNRVVIIPKNSFKDDGTWAFEKGNREYNGTFSDCLSWTKSVDVEVVKRMLDFYDNKIIFSPSSEEGGMKGTYVIMNKELQDLRMSSFEKARVTQVETYSGLMHGNIGPLVYTIYGDSSKHVARVRSLMSNDSAAAYDLEAKKVNLAGDFIFDRHRCYLSQNKADIGMLNSRTKTTINLMVGYLPGREEATKLTLSEFTDADKVKLSRYLEGTDCHLNISEDAANIMVTINRTNKYPITDECVSSHFRILKSQLEREQSVDVAPDFVVGYKAICRNETCQSIMTPVKPGFELPDGSIEWKTSYADENHKDWYCSICEEHQRMDARKVKINSKYKSAFKFIVKGIEYNDDNEVSINMDVVLPINVSRLTSEEGLKGLSVIMGQDFIGYASGTIFNPETGKYDFFADIPLDMSLNIGSMKGKESGIALSNIRLMNALTGSKYCPDEIYRQDKNEDRINSEVVSKIQKVTVRRRSFDPETMQFVWTNEQAYVGIISVDVTETADEFLKVKTEDDDMKVSHMNPLFYKWLGFNDLNKAMMKSSIDGMFNENNKDFLRDLLACFYSDTTGRTEVKTNPENELNDFNNINGSIQVINWLEKSEWHKLLTHHPMFKDGSKFTNGAWHKDSSGNVIVFPKRKTLLRLVDIMNGGRVRLSSIPKQLLYIFLDLYTKGYTDRLEKYKNDIYDKLLGKQGVFARSATFIDTGFGGKEIGSGYIPTGVIVVGNPSFWTEAKKNLGSKLPISWNEVCNGKATLYGTSQRDPFIWIAQAANAVQVWPVQRANKYFMDNYGIRFTDMYPNFTGVMLNVLDMLYLFQTDADGDYRRCIVPYSVEAQIELAKLNAKMHNYDLFCKASPDSIAGKIYRRTAKWHLSYVVAEATTAADKIEKPLKIKVTTINTRDITNWIVKGVKSKGNIGIITTSQWKIQAFADWISKKGIPIVPENGELVPLTHDDVIAILLFYQTQFTQDGCVRALKGQKDLGDYNFDNIAINVLVPDEDVISRPLVPIRKKVQQEADAAGYGDIVHKFFALADYWKLIADISLNEDTNKIVNNGNVWPQAEMINAYIAACNGSRYVCKNPHNLFERLAHPDSAYISEKEFIAPIIPYLEFISEKKERERANNSASDNLK